MRLEPNVLVVGGSYRRQDGAIVVQPRSWETIRIFSDHMARPVFAMQEAPGRDVGL